jgi:hypothetical protein
MIVKADDETSTRLPTRRNWKSTRNRNGKEMTWEEKVKYDGQQDGDKFNRMKFYERICCKNRVTNVKDQRTRLELMYGKKLID